ncbi:MAG TPA: tyrosinase family protein [Allosphingosinicella sp.]|nr:tyrosinase family protein [Allosphingosinicella sp.]
MEKLGTADFEAPLDFFGTTDRRVFVKGLGMIGASLLLGTLGGCDKIAEAIRNRPVRRRLRTGSAAVDADIETYRQAVAAMKALPANDVLNWIVEANIHGTAAGFNMCEHGTDHFFDWHRAYLFYFEKICQRLTNNSRFGLPYWNWNQNNGIHAAFLDSNSTLFSARSRTTMAGNSVVSTPTLDPIFQDGNFFTFGTQIEGTPHNNVHSWIGGILGSYQSAQDPLFWMHHCMIDYCWYKWNIELQHNNPNAAAWTNKVNGQFVDANRNPATSVAISTVLMPLLAYRYESSAIGSSAAVADLTSAKEYQRLEARIRAGADIRFQVSQRTRLAERLEASAARPVSLRSTLRARDFAQLVESRAAQEQVFASIEYAQVPAATDFSVRVFVNLPNATRATSSDDLHFAGSFAFFGGPPPGAAAEAEARPSTHRHQPRFLVNLTPTIRRLRARGLLGESDPLSVQLVPTPFDPEVAAPDAALQLNALEIITTPVIVAARPE